MALRWGQILADAVISENQGLDFSEILAGLSDVGPVRAALLIAAPSDGGGKPVELGAWGEVADLRADASGGWCGEQAGTEQRGTGHMALSVGTAEARAGILLTDLAGGEREFADAFAVSLNALLAKCIAVHERITKAAGELQRLRDSERRYRSLVDVSNEIVQSVDAQGRILFVNAAWKRLLGFHGMDMVGEPIFDHIHGDSLAHCQQGFQQVFEGKPLLGIDVILKKRSGERAILYGDVFPLQDAGRTVATQAFFRDVTEQRAAAVESQRKQAFLDQVVESAPEAIVFLDVEGTIQRVNSEFTRMFGYTVVESIGHRLDDLIVPPAASDEGVDICRRASQGERLSIEVTRADKERRMVDVSLLASPIFVDGKQVATLAIYRDISNRKRLERDLARAQRMEAIGRFAGGISHDFNNVLTVINATTDLIKLGLPESDPMREDVEEIARAGQRASALTRQLLTFSRRQVLQMTTLDLNAIVTDVGSMLHRVIGENIQMSTTFESEMVYVRGDRTQLEQVLMNLALNARDAMPHGGSLSIFTRRAALDEEAIAMLDLESGEYVSLSVSDTGCGIRPDDMDDIFEPFYSTKAIDGQGTGLGLATVLGIVKQSRGGIHVESKVGVGSTFTVYLPASDSTTEASSKGVRSAAVGEGECVLVMEDDDAIRAVAERSLRQAGFDVLVADSLDDAIVLVRQHGTRIKVLFTDVIMPGASGREVADRLQELHPGLRVLFTSGYTGGEGVDGIGMRGRHFLPKPYTGGDIAEKLREVLEAEA